MDEGLQVRYYEIRVRSLLGEMLLSAFPGLHAEVQGWETVLTGQLADQSALYGVLGLVESLGLELLAVRRVPPSEIEGAPE
jgi:hypothetical protein